MLRPFGGFHASVGCDMLWLIELGTKGDSMGDRISDSAPLYALIIIVGFLTTMLLLGFGLGRLIGAW